MEGSHYEQHHYEDPKFPVLFHLDTLSESMVFVPHWHQNLEILYFLEGGAAITIDTEEIAASAGDVVVIPTNALHNVVCTTALTSYYCLIVDWDFCGALGLPLDTLDFRRRIREPALCARLDALAEELRDKAPYCKAQALSDIISIMVYLARHQLAPSRISLSETQSSRLEMVKRVFLYIDQHYAEPLTMDQLAGRAGFTKYYFCHIFKELTGMTPVSYINFIRCRKAKEFLTVKGCNVGEAAVLCGFTNLSYFTKTYKKYNGELPSSAMK